MSPVFEDTAWAWVEHLRHGGSTPWTAFTAADPAGEHGEALPGAAELELVRRLAARTQHTPGVAHFDVLADLVLARSGPGRGLPHLPLSWPDRPAPAFGARPVDPERVPAEELVRVGVGTLAALLLADPVVPSAPEPPRFRKLRTPRFHVAGAPLTRAAVRQAFEAAGHVESHRKPEVVLLLRPFDVHLAEVWSARVQAGAPVQWPVFTARSSRRDRLPPSLRLDEIAALWAAKVGAGRVHLVVGDADTARRATEQVTGLQAAPVAPGYPFAALGPAGTDVLRRLNRVLDVRLAAEHQDTVRARAVALLGTAAAPVAVPQAQRGWARTEAERLVFALRAGGYPVVGDLDEVAPRHTSPDVPVAPRRREVLDLVLDACLDLHAQRAGSTGAVQEQV